MQLSNWLLILAKLLIAVKSVKNPVNSPYHLKGLCKHTLKIPNRPGNQQKRSPKETKQSD